MSIKVFYDRVQHKLVENTNPFLGGIRRKWGGVNKEFTIISNNCWAGSVYRYFNMPYLSPTAGLYFYEEEYIKFLNNLEGYCGMELEEISLDDSKYKESLISKGQINVPIGKISNIEIVFLHYPNFKEAKEKWVRRCKRINWDNLIVKNAEMNLCTREHILEFDRMPFNTKFIFTTKDYGIESQIIFGEYKNKDQVKDDTTLFNKYVNVTNLVTGKPFKK